MTQIFVFIYLFIYSVCVCIYICKNYVNNHFESYFILCTIHEGGFMSISVAIGVIYVMYITYILCL